MNFGIAGEKQRDEYINSYVKKIVNARWCNTLNWSEPNQRQHTLKAHFFAF